MSESPRDPVGAGVFSDAAPSLRPIETVYAGHTFRSRLEARWAMFFDGLALPWLYEPEAFQFEKAWWLGKTYPSVRYLPDFFLPSIETWVEIKPHEPSSRERACCAELADASGRRVVLFWGHPGFWLDAPRSEACSSEFFGPGGGWDYGYEFCECPQCRRIDVHFEGRSGRMSCPCPKPFEERGHNGDAPRIIEAAAAANAHRFWVGPR